MNSILNRMMRNLSDYDLGVFFAFTELLTDQAAAAVRQEVNRRSRRPVGSGSPELSTSGNSGDRRSFGRAPLTRIGRRESPAPVLAS